jgi:hypothetical protein
VRRQKTFWPGSVIEQMKIIDPLTNPTAHGGNASDAFHLVMALSGARLYWENKLWPRGPPTI